ncbi:hypothetical protein [Pseudomonas nitroreducens]|uniref:hypothetical protein n=1 Tax=Pseudomonas nitroreducens TaxID=46680 RepID=UPI002657F219|nr:hypothetical protein [Pseudomonas nitroreducens]MCP1650420.1 hypothetical protein [Pseudomonas nitroreducens]MCP1688372.1 hypothetical protein [Pseudomonas nitroreducens]
MDIPESMKEELGRWNNGAGIDLEGWIDCTGNYSLAVGYLTLFWPEFVEFDGYILRKGFSEDSLRAFERVEGATRESVEWVMNHLHIADIHFRQDAQFSEDKSVVLGNALKEIYEAKLARQFPHRDCVVELYAPEAEGDFTDYQLSFWQAAPDTTS